MSALNGDIADPVTLVNHWLIARRGDFYWWLSVPVTWLFEEWENYEQIANKQLARSSVIYWRLLSVCWNRKHFWDWLWLAYNDYLLINEEEPRVASQSEHLQQSRVPTAEKKYGDSDI